MYLIYIIMSSIDKSKSPILEQKMNKENSLGINDPVLIEFYKSLKLILFFSFDIFSIKGTQIEFVTPG